MNDSTQKILGSTSSQHPIKIMQQAPNGWVPIQIIYKKITFSMTTDGLQIFYHPDSHVVPDGDIETFIDKLFHPTHGGLLALSSPPSPLDFTIYAPPPCFPSPCSGYLVFELDRKGNWEFQHDVDAATTSNNNASDYFNLVHVIKPKTTRKGQNPPGHNCKVAYFSFTSPSPNGSHPKGAHPPPDSFNFYATLKVGRKRLNLTIDPDITNTGGPPPGLGDSGRKHPHHE